MNIVRFPGPVRPEQDEDEIPRVIGCANCHNLTFMVIAVGDEDDGDVEVRCAVCRLEITESGGPDVH